LNDAAKNKQIARRASAEAGLGQSLIEVFIFAVSNLVVAINLLA
jgi:hypothetical protein